VREESRFDKMRVKIRTCGGYEHSEKTRAPYTNGPKDVPRCGALSLLQKPLHHMDFPAFV
jgi:hypothetical protein